MKKTISADVGPELVKELERCAAAKGWSLSQLIRVILEDWYSEDCLWSIRVDRKAEKPKAKGGGWL